MNKEEREKLYVITYPSTWGMGSDTDISLIAEPALKELILMETDRYVAGDRFADDRFSGTWNGEKFCDSSDPEERIADVMNKRLNKSSTYAKQNDLIELPGSVQVAVSEIRMKDTIVRLCNQFACGRDIIFGEGDFTLYSLDAEQDFFKENDVFGWFGGPWLRFVSYSLKNVAEYHMVDFSSLAWILHSRKDKLRRLQGIQKRKPVKHKGAYITDLTPEIVDDDYLAREIEEARCTLDKFTNLPDVKDEYLSHLYDPEHCTNEFTYNTIMTINDRDRKIDHTRVAYSYPIAPYEFGAKYQTEKDDPSDHLTYSELFKKGYDIRYLLADYSNTADTCDELGDPDLVSVFRSVFAYD